MSASNGWVPETRLGQQVADGEIDDIDDALNSGLPLKEVEVVDQLVSLDDEVLDINMVQRMTDSGRRVKFRCVVVVGNRNGLIGYAQGRDDQVGGAIEKAIDVAKLNLVRVPLGSGSWEDQPGGDHSLIRKSEGTAGSVTVEVRPAPKGLGLAAAETPRKVLELAGVEDAWTKSHGNTRTTVNLAKATYNALVNAAQARIPQRVHERQREVNE